MSSVTCQMCGSTNAFPHHNSGICSHCRNHMANTASRAQYPLAISSSWKDENSNEEDLTVSEEERKNRKILADILRVKKPCDITVTVSKTRPVQSPPLVGRADYSSPHLDGIDELARFKFMMKFPLTFKVLQVMSRAVWFPFMVATWIMIKITGSNDEK